MPGASYGRHLAFIIYTGCAALAVVNHEPWRDEAQAWLIARDLPLADLFRQMAYEGTPALWHLLIRPLAISGFPYFSINVLHLTLAMAGAAIWLYASPFSDGTRYLFAFSYYIIWEYAVIARSYILCFLLALSIAAAYRRRFKSPLLFAGMILLLFNSTVHGFFLAGSIGLLFIYELFERGEDARRRVWSVSVIAVGALLAIAQLWSPPDNRNYGLFTTFSWKTPFFALGDAFFPDLPRVGYLTVIAGCLLFLVCGLYLISRSKRVFFVFSGSCAGLFYIFVFKHAGTLRHHGLLLVALVFCLWLCRYYDDGLDLSSVFHPVVARFVSKDRISSCLFLGLQLSLMLSIIPAVNRHVMEYRYPFSGSRMVGRFLLENNLAYRPIAAFPSHNASAVLPYLKGVRFWYADVEQYGTFVTWNQTFEKNRHLPIEQALDRIETRFAGEPGVLVLLSEPIPTGKRAAFRLLFQIDQNVFGYGDERYYLYERL